MSFKPYPKYKESGVEWLGRVPEHWEVRRLRQIGPLLKGSGGTKEDIVEGGVPCVRYGDLYTTHSYFIRQARTFVTAERAADYFPIRVGDVLFAASGEDLAEIGRSAVNLIETEAVCGGDTVVLRPDGRAVPAFLGYACDSWVAKAQKASMGRGTTVKHIYPDELKRLVIFVPSPDEQALIADFLDAETAKIDALIAEQQRLIELLQEKRQAVISHAVTKGLNPDAPMKDSRVEWLGEVPEHWDTTKVKFVTAMTADCPHETPEYSDDGEYRVIRTADVEEGKLREAQMYRLTESQYLRRVRRATLDAGDVVYTREGERWGLAATVPSAGRYCLGQRMLQLRARSDFCSYFLMWHLSARCVYAQAEVDTIGATAPHVNLSSIVNFFIVEPPLGEQRNISKFLKAATSAMDRLMGEAEHAITLLQERRSALISAAVTGQIDVRSFAGTEAA